MSVNQKSNKLLFIILIIVLAIPTFFLMLRYGIFSMQDFHLFRLVEFDKCVKILQLPCRWAYDSGAGYGEPVFNFYGQFVYWVGEIFHLISFSKIDSIKLVFITSFIGSAVGMFFLSRKVWKNDLSALVSSIIYLYAPYRAVDVWVRGALPEAFSFVFFPLIILAIENYLETSKRKHLLLFSLLFSLLIINHNLSVILFAPFLIIWIIFRFLQIRKIRPILELLIAGIFSGFLSAFYLLPVVFESKFVGISDTTTGVYDWRANFVTIYQLFISRFWGYGGSTWGSDDGLSLSIGQIQWIIPAIAFVTILIKKRLNKETLTFFILVLIGLFGLFLTHNKSTFIWNNLAFMKYIQFPWRFLAVVTFALALASGFFVKQFNNRKNQLLVTFGIIVFAIALNFNFFREDIWYKVKDSDLETGAKWDEARFSSINDYWPDFGHKIPDKISDGTYINYFPGWNHRTDKQSLVSYAPKNGLILAKGAVFRDTPVRSLGNSISLISLVIWIIVFVKLKHKRSL